MRWLILLLSAVAPIAAATIALAADTVVPGGRITVPAPARASPSSRSAGTARYTPIAPRPSPAADATDCRMACAQASYLCRRQNDPEDCDPAWSRCVAVCALPNLAGYGVPGPSAAAP